MECSKEGNERDYKSFSFEVGRGRAFPNAVPFRVRDWSGEGRVGVEGSGGGRTGGGV